MILNPNVNYKYEYTVNYNKYSANMSHGYSSAVEAQAAGVQEAIRLASFDTVIRSVEIKAYCPDCDGRGVNYSRVGKRVQRQVEKKCPACKGKNSTVVIIGE